MNRPSNKRDLTKIGMCNVKNTVELSLRGTSAVKMIDGGNHQLSNQRKADTAEKIIKITVLAHSKHKAFN
jgi:hypothetical protein